MSITVAKTVTKKELASSVEVHQMSEVVDRVTGGNFGMDIERWCQERAARDGLPFDIYRIQRPGADDDRVRYDLRISAQGAAFMLTAAKAVAAALDTAAEDFARDLAEVMP